MGTFREMIISLDIAELLKLKAGALLVLSWYSRDDGGQRFTPGQYNGERKGRLHFTIRPFGEREKKLSLAEYDTAYKDVHGQVYSVKLPTEKELQYCRKSFMDGEEQEEESQPMTPKEIAIALIGVMSAKPTSAKKLCEMAELEYSEGIKTVVPIILGKLADAGKISLTRVHNAAGKRVRRWALPE